MAMNAQKEILELYGSDSLIKSAAGVWLKLTYEFLVVTIPIGVAALSLGYFHPSIELTTQFTSNSASVIWGSISLTVTGIVWCFSLTTVSIEEINDDESMAYDEDEVATASENGGTDSDESEVIAEVEEVK